MKVRLREEALQDLSAIRRWYFDRNPVVARSIAGRVQDRLVQLAEYAEIGERARGRVDRTLTVTGTPLVIVYRIDLSVDLVDVIAIIDARRDPEQRFLR